MNRTLYLKKKNSKGEEVLFPSSEQPAFITEYTYSAARMGGVPTITGTVKHPLCLDDLWTREEYVEFEGVKFYVTQVPTSSKSNDDIRYKHEITFRSERDLLDNIYFFDVVTPQTESQYADRFRSNATKFSFYGDIKEFVSRLNDSLVYSGIGDKFNIILDEGIESDTKEISFSDKFFSEALQEIFNIFAIPYYWVGNVCHIGYNQDGKIFSEDETLTYGQGKGLLSVLKTNGNYRLIDRITGVGSSQNIPHYYPNDSAVGTSIYEVANMNVADVQSIDLNKILSYNTDVYNTVYVLKYTQPSLDFALDISNERAEYQGTTHYSEGLHSGVRGSVIYGHYVKLSAGSNVVLSDLTANAASYNPEIATIRQSEYVGVIASGELNITEYEEVPVSKQIIEDGIYFVGIRLKYDILRVQNIDSPPQNFLAVSRSGATRITYKGGDGYVFSYNSEGEQLAIPYDKSGIKLVSPDSLPCTREILTLQTESFYGHTLYEVISSIAEETSPNAPASIHITGRKWVAPQQNLMPPIYLESEGAERFYNAINGEYEHPDGGHYVFLNEYEEGKQREGIVSFDDIMPTIKGVINAEGKPFGEVVDVTFDAEDSDAQDDEGNYIHSYFYIKLNIFNGDYGFNLFAQALESGSATINMTSGDCSPCAFEIATEKELIDGTYVFYNPVVTDGSGNLRKVSDINSGSSYLGDYIATIENRDKWTAEQQNTYANSVWIAVKKENSTFGIVMPNGINNHKPKTGDTFVITNILMPNVLVRAAEERLKNQLLEHLAQHNNERFDFSVKLSREYIYTHKDIANKINENSKINVVYNDKTYPLYVTNYTCRADGNILNEISVELATELSPSQNSIQKQISAIKGDIIKAASKTKPSSVDLASLDKRYLSKLSDDTAKGEITFEKGAKFGQSNGINEQGNATLNDVTASKYKGKNGIVSLDGNTEINGDANVSENLDVTKNAIIGGNAQIGGDAEIGGLAKAKSVEIGDYIGGDFGTGGKIYTDKQSNSHAVLDYLTIRKKATFNEISVKELKHVGGTIILSAASMVIESVEDIGGAYICYFKTQDGEGNEIHNEWEVDDLARCQTFNLDSGNRYYWRKVIGVGTDFIVLSKTECDPSANNDEPKAGDNLALLGNTSDITRQSAIVLSAYGEDAPSRKVYNSISDFSLKDKEVYGEAFDKTTNKPLSVMYGDSYIGDRDETTFMRFTTEEGLQIKGKVETTIGGTNLLLNTAFLGDYEDMHIEDGLNLNRDSVVYSPALTYWSHENVEVVDDNYCKSGKVAKLTNGWLEQKVVNPPKSTDYVLSFNAKGTGELIVVINMPIGEQQHRVSLDSTWAQQTIHIKAISSAYILVTFYTPTDATIGDIQLERGYNVTDWKPSEEDPDKAYANFKGLGYLQDAVRNGKTDIIGGLILSKMLVLGNYKDNQMVKTTAGISGVYNDDTDVAFWAGGDLAGAMALVQKVRENPTYSPTEDEWANLAKVAITHGGDTILKGTIFADNGYFRGRLEAKEGYFNGEVSIADGKIQMNTDGSGHLANENVKWNKEGDLDIEGYVTAKALYRGFDHVYPVEQRLVKFSDSGSILREWNFLVSNRGESNPSQADFIIITGDTGDWNASQDADNYYDDEYSDYIKEQGFNNTSCGNVFIPNPTTVEGKEVTIINTVKKIDDSNSSCNILLYAKEGDQNSFYYYRGTTGVSEDLEYISLANIRKIHLVSGRMGTDYAQWIVLDVEEK